MTYYDDELDTFVREKLELIQPTAARNPEIAQQRREEYLKKVKYLRFGKPLFLFTGILANKPWQGLFRHRPAFAPFAAAMVLIFGLVFGSWGTVYAAQNSLPDEPLYAVKLAGEDLQLAFTRDTEARISLLTAFAGRRVDEATVLALRGEPVPDDLVALMDAYVVEVFALADGLDGASRQAARAGIQLQERDLDQCRTGPAADLDFEPARNMNQHGINPGDDDSAELTTGISEPITPTVSITPTVTITPTITPTPGVTVTRTITPATNGPSWGPGEPCAIPGACTPAGNTWGPDATPIPGEYGPGDEQGPGPQNPTEPPKPDDKGNEGPKATPDPGGDGDAEGPKATPEPSGDSKGPKVTPDPGGDGEAEGPKATPDPSGDGSSYQKKP
jgi:hypothetical protein